MTGLDSKFTSKRAMAVAAVSALLAAAPVPANADTAMTAGVVLDKMSADERFAYIAGIVEGFAFYASQGEGGETARVKCIYDWYYIDTKATVTQISQTFERFRDKYPAAIIAALVKKRCGA